METVPPSVPSLVTPSVLHDRPGFPVLRVLKYLGLALLCNGALWALSLGYLKQTKPVYTSELILNISGAGQGVNLNLPDVGQAMTSTTTAYGSTADPRENYKLMTLGPTILTAAAQSLNLSRESFGQPKIKIINNTTMMEIAVTAESPQVAQQKAEAVYRVLNQRLQTLRANEQNQRNRAIQAAVNAAQTKLSTAQQQLSRYKADSGLNSSEQITGLIATIESLRQQRAELTAQEQQIGDRQRQLSASLGLSAQEAAQALLLQTDQQFQKSLKDYSQATLTLATLLEYRGENYPDVVLAKETQVATLAVLLARGERLLGDRLDQLTLERLSLDNGNGSGVKRSELFQQLVVLKADHEGLVGQLKGLTEQIKQLEVRLATVSQKLAVLDRRLRDLNIAEAIFTSTLAKVDLSKSDPYGSFPLVEMVEAPSLPEEATAPKPKLVLAGSVIGSFLVTLGLTLIWWRSPILKVSKQAVRDIIA